MPASITGGATASGNGVVFSGTLLAAQPPDVAIGPGSSPAGYIPLSAFGVPPVVGVGDETISNFFVPAFHYAGEVYTQIAMVSNGYAVVGRRDQRRRRLYQPELPRRGAAQQRVCAVLDRPRSEPAGGALRVAALTDGTNSWVVLDWEAVREFSAARVNSFQIWIGINGVEDITLHLRRPPGERRWRVAHRRRRKPVWKPRRRTSTWTASAPCPPAPRSSGSRPPLPAPVRRA